VFFFAVDTEIGDKFIWMIFFVGMENLLFDANMSDELVYNQ